MNLPWVSAKKMRQIFLIACLVSYVAMQTMWALLGHWGFFGTFVAIIICVLIGEAINVKWLYGKTLSTEVTKKIEEGKKRIYAYLAGLFMCLAIFFLFLHLVWH
jgi:uncharacterized paraquat-inducible protein A